MKTLTIHPRTELLCARASLLILAIQNLLTRRQALVRRAEQLRLEDANA